MIASLSGLVQVKTPSAVIVDVGGVGYEVFISVRTFDTLPDCARYLREGTASQPLILERVFLAALNADAAALSA